MCPFIAANCQCSTALTSSCSTLPISVRSAHWLIQCHFSPIKAIKACVVQFSAKKPCIIWGNTFLGDFQEHHVVHDFCVGGLQKHGASVVSPVPHCHVATSLHICCKLSSISCSPFCADYGGLFELCSCVKLSLTSTFTTLPMLLCRLLYSLKVGTVQGYTMSEEVLSER